MAPAGTVTPQIVILGAGPAGLSAALWLHKLGLRPLLLEAAGQAGGMLNENLLPNDWVLGQVGLTGPQLAGRFAGHVAGLALAPRLHCQPSEIRRHEHGWRLALRNSGDAESIDAAAVLIATGTRPRAQDALPGVEGLAAAAPYIVYGPPAFAGLDGLRGQRVLVVGGGDNALENARFLLDQGCEVWVAARSRFRAQRAMMEAVVGHPRAHLLSPVRLRALQPAGGGLRVLLDAAPHELVVDRMHVLAGYAPNTDFLRDALPPALFAQLGLDAEGYLGVDAAARTGCAGLYAAGDVCNPLFPSVVSAIAQGALAAKTIELDLRQPPATP
ncbi:NAD(P)/FAD-dependent oxidoreductase [Uliginosibacterium sp. H1]|uniref:NAD(P)/FAD-dependent oxidoreductase n=1 Tax=Uliginosibacterium sp. H1 TaxID=3114757 RepID=UPI002E18A3D2|nr:NAD(P)/FAD-dependent oxidoreductase [Uliginosibacterium sp. H1]